MSAHPPYTTKSLLKHIGKPVRVRWIDSGMHAFRTFEYPNMELGVFILYGLLTHVHPDRIVVASEHMDDIASVVDQDRSAIKITDIERFDVLRVVRK